MKKNIFSLGVLAAAAIALVGCAKTETNVPEVKGTGIPFEFTATSAVTKTTNDTEATNWVAGDKVNLFHAELGGTAITYVSDGAFTAATDGAEVKFTGTLAEGFDPDGTYNWYAFYPYTSQITTPANRDAGYVYIGGRSDRAQTQKGNDSMDHIAGNNYPIAGIAEKISGSEKLSIAMTHLTSLLEVSVINGTSEPITVTDIAFTGTEDLVGQYYIDFSESAAVYTPYQSDRVSNTAKLTVEDGTPIDSGDEAYFYLAVKPFTAPAGGTLTLKVTTAEHGAQEVEKTFNSAVAFEAGVENFLTFTYDKAGEVVYDKIADLTGKAANDDVIVEGQVTALSGKGFVVTDDTGSVFVYSNQNESSNYQIGQNVTVSGSISFYNKSIQIAPTSVTEGATGSYSYPDPEVFGLDKVTAYNADSNNRLASYVTYTGRLVNGGSYWNLIVGSGVTTANATLYYQTQDMTGFEDGDMVVVTGYAVSVMSGRCAVIPTDIQHKVVPKLTYNTVPDVAADGITNGTLPVTISNAEGWTMGITYDGEVVTAASLNSNEIAYTVSKNTGTTTRTGTISVTFSKSGEEDVIYTISIAQLAEAAAGTAYVLNGTVTDKNASPYNSYSAESDITQDLVTWMVMGNTAMNPWRIGGKSLSGVDRPVYSTAPISENISKIEIEHGSADSITVNSMTVTVASDAEFKNVISTLTPTFAANGTVTVERPSGADWTGRYYKIVYNVTVSGTSNKFVQLVKVTFYK